MKKMLSRIASTFLSGIFLVTQSPTLFVEVANAISNITYSSSALEPEILEEIPEKRSEFTKHFRMSDGSMKAIIYSEPVHYKNGEEFKEIDNTLIEGENDTYKNADNPFKVNFSKNFKNKGLVTINSSNHNLSLSYIKKKYKEFNTEVLPLNSKDKEQEVSTDTDDKKENVSEITLKSDNLETSTNKQNDIISDSNKSVTKITTKALTSAAVEAIPTLEAETRIVKIENLKDKQIHPHLENKNEGKTSVNKICSKAKYENSDNDIDLDYSVSSFGLKENIVLRKKLSDNDRFDFEIKTELNLSKDDKGNINFKDSEGKKIFIMPKGSMWDSKEIYSNELEYEIIEINEGYIISIIPNRDWLESAERVYPITIDPSITTSLEASSYEYAVTDPSNPDTPNTSHTHIPVGTSDLNYIPFLRLKKLPKFSNGEFITKANFKLYIPSSYSYMPVYFGELPQYDCIRSVTEPWNVNLLTHRNQPNVDNTVEDYCEINSLGKYYQWDITRMTKKWYCLDNPNDNYGFSINSYDPNLYGLVRFIGKNNTDYPDKTPKLEISYKDFVGEEDHWSYTNHGAGYKGVGRVNNYAGTLSVSENILSYSGSRNPVSIENTYNNVNYNENANGHVHNKVFSGGYNHSSYTGHGFRLSFNRLIYPIPETDSLYNTGFRYVYVDGDGTQHYFKEKENEKEFTDEDGLNLTIKISGNNLELSDKTSNKMTFEKIYSSDECYALKSSEDIYKNKSTYNYGYQSDTENSKVDKITDAAGRETTISYNENGMVSDIQSSDNKKIIFNYERNKLKEVIYPDNIRTIYNYDFQGRLLKIGTDEGTGRSIKYEYVSNDFENLNFFKVRTVTEYGSMDADPKSKGKSIDFWYEMNQTKITHKINNLDVPYRERSEVWQFDSHGRMTAVLDENGNMISNIYETEGGGKNHKIKHTNDSGKYVNNLLKNTYAEKGMEIWTEDNWIDGNLSSHALVTTTDKTESSLGTNCFKVTRNADDSSWPIARQKVLIPKKSYDRKFTFSGDIKTVSALKGGNGASLHIASFSSDGQQMSGDEYSKWITSTNGNWQRESVTINIPAGAEEIECTFGIKESIGTAYFDCLQLEENDTAHDYNMVENSSFDSNWESWTPSEDVTANDIISDSRLKLIGAPTSDKKVSQTISVNKIDPVFAVRANSQGLAIPKYTSSSAKYCIEFILNFSDGSSKTIEIPFNSDVSDVQSLYRSIGPASYGKGKTVTSIVVGPRFSSNCNTVYFDNIQVYIDDSDTIYDRNDKGSITGITNNLGDSFNFNRDTSSDEIVEKIDSRGNKIYREYSNNANSHELTASTTETPKSNVKSAFEYDSFGNFKKYSITKEENADEKIANEKIVTFAEYNSEKGSNYLEKVTDSRDKITNFDYNKENGNLKSVQNSNGISANYTYDNAGRILSEICENFQKTYSYTQGMLNSISHKVEDNLNTTYNFIRDMFGNISETKIGDKSLSKNKYDDGNGLLRQVKYGNEQTINYDYDDKGRIIKKSFGYEKGNKFGEITYLYDSKNRLVESYDSLNNITNKIEYDKYGRIKRTIRSDGTSSEVYYTNLGSLIDKVISNIFRVKQVIENTFGKSNMLLESKITNNNSSVWSKYNYDNLGRISSTEAVNNEETQGIEHKINYCDYNKDSELRTTNFVSSLEINKKIENQWTSIVKKFNYTYDDIGNIISIEDENGNLLANYEYDSLNQLVCEDNKQTGKIVKYKYNAGQNLTKKTIYTDTNVEITNESKPESTIIYKYEDINWPDKLTSYTDGTTQTEIIYDAIGNPLSYKGWNLEWSRGRRLDKMSSSVYNINISFKYNENGIRTQKSVGDTKTDFITSGIQLLAQQTGDNILIWQIDAKSNIVGFTYNGTQYFYIKNLQGDIIGITDSSGDIISEYKYDSWGKLISITDQNGIDRTSDIDFIGYINPLRYRSYYYDSETELYYLNDRYYDPEVGRFINPDGNFSGSSGLFVYCFNNPINYVDVDGEIALHIIGATAIIGAGVVIAAVSYKVMSSFTWDNENKIYYAGIDMWQRDFGYDDLYDLAIPWISKEKIEFQDENKKSWIVWMWKGYYGPLLGTGAEIGIYAVEPFRKFPVPFKIDNRCAKNDEMLEMSYTLKYKKDKVLFQRGPEKHWWLVGFKPSSGFHWGSNLTLDCSITFPSYNMRTSFVSSAKTKKNISLLNEEDKVNNIKFIWG